MFPFLIFVIFGVSEDFCLAVRSHDATCPKAVFFKLVAFSSSLNCGSFLPSLQLHLLSCLNKSLKSPNKKLNGFVGQTLRACF